ncbi:hypothetical protein IFT66_21375 [Rhizobium sp. CFBP 13726]|uniref:hypothetical protein n=1 Tax=Rhizobium sp. CFBP 13726 TaxID=2775296 RepID=UPI00177FE45A|nr:hypothetical protein [Rhizobium sp. CFBP 13726]MBD8653650.1 hypothetical protein [Rhizobium sp. CFBP 13726]
MKTMTTVIRLLAIDIVVIETTQADAVGIAFYYAEILVRERGTGSQRLVRRTRIPGTGKELLKAVQQHGVRALDRFATATAFSFS